MQPESQIFARQALTPEGWRDDVLIAWDAAGYITQCEAWCATLPEVSVVDVALPGMANVHSHLFQWAMAGLTETASPAGQDNFWSWREVMYRFVNRLTPDQISVISRAFFSELLLRGYTSVGEFHYLHHDSNGTPYANPAEMSERVIAAAQETGIHLTLLPVMYETANFGGIPAHEGQRRFVHRPDAFLRLLETLRKKYPALSLGIAPHSLRAVTPESLATIIEALPSLGLGNCPIHMHVAEQVKEVEDCVNWSGMRPIEWLAAHHNINARWCLIHATHLTDGEVAQLAASGAIAGLCPTTEANLGDGIFATESYLKQGGCFGVGSDSQVCLSPFEELRQLEYAQRLITRTRNVLHGPHPSVGRTLYENAATGGAQALSIASGALAIGKRADIACYRPDHPLLTGKRGDALLDSWIFAQTPRAEQVIVGGRVVVQSGQAIAGAAALKDLRPVMSALLV